MNQKIRDLCEQIVDEAIATEAQFVLDDVKFTVIEGILNKSVSISAASVMLGISRNSIHLMKSKGYITDRKRVVGRRAEV